MEYLDETGTKELIDKLKKYIDETVDPHPVGSMYFTVDTTFDPAKKFGGTWERIENRYIILAGDKYPAGSTGGSDLHTLTVDEMPAHKHTVSIDGWQSEYLAYSALGYTCATKKGSATVKTTSTGGGKPFSIIPSYFGVVGWRRTA